MEKIGRNKNSATPEIRTDVIKNINKIIRRLESAIRDNKNTPEDLNINTSQLREGPAKACIGKEYLENTPEHFTESVQTSFFLNLKSEFRIDIYSSETGDGSTGDFIKHKKSLISGPDELEIKCIKKTLKQPSN